MASTLLLDQTAWDLVLDASGNIALAGEPYAIAQDVASAVRTFITECAYDTDQGLPYFGEVLGELPPAGFLRQKIQDIALTVPKVAAATVVFVDFAGRGLTGQIQITDSDGNTSEANF